MSSVLQFGTLAMSSELTFRDRFTLVAGDHPFTWGAERGLQKHFVASCLRGNYRPQAKNMEKLVAATGIPANWWLNGEGPPPEVTPPAPVPLNVPGTERRIALRRLNASPSLTRDQEILSGISAKGLTYVMTAALATADKGEPLAVTVNRAVQLYLLAAEKGLINVPAEDGENVDKSS